MHETWDRVDKAIVFHQDGHLWIQVERSGDIGDVNLVGTSGFMVMVRRGNKMVPLGSETFQVDNPAGVVYFYKEVPPLMTLKIFDRNKVLQVHVRGASPLEVV